MLTSLVETVNYEVADNVNTDVSIALPSCCIKFVVKDGQVTRVFTSDVTCAKSKGTVRTATTPSYTSPISYVKVFAVSKLEAIVNTAVKQGF